MSKVTKNLQNIVFCLPQKILRHTDLEKHEGGAFFFLCSTERMSYEGEKMKTDISFLADLSFWVNVKIA